MKMMFLSAVNLGSRERLEVDAKTDFFVFDKAPTRKSRPLEQTHTDTYNGHTKSSRHLRSLEKRSLGVFPLNEQERQDKRLTRRPGVCARAGHRISTHILLRRSCCHYRSNIQRCRSLVYRHYSHLERSIHPTASHTCSRVSPPLPTTTEPFPLDCYMHHPRLP